MDTRHLTDLHEDLAKMLIKRLRKKPKTALMTYGELCKLVGNQTDPRNIARYLGDLSAWCHDIGAPMISALIYNKETNIPGKGFFILYGDLYGKKVNKGEEEEVFISEVNKVLRYKHWERLEYYLGL